MKNQVASVLAVAMLLGIALVRPPYPKEQWLQHTPTAIALVALAWAPRRQWLSGAAMGCLLGMIVLHIAGARWIYSNMPYERWCDAAFGSGPEEWFGWTRNHYDRLVHLGFGLLMPLPLAETAARYGNLCRRWAFAWALMAVAGMSAAYEVFEWLLANIASPRTAEHYNGQQGDMWDGQKDMALAIAGSIIAALGLVCSNCCGPVTTPTSAAVANRGRTR